MKAVTIVSFGGVEGLEVRDVSDAPRAIAERVRVRVRAAGLNRADILQRLGRYPAPRVIRKTFRDLNSPAKLSKSGMKRARGKSAIEYLGLPAAARRHSL